LVGDFGQQTPQIVTPSMAQFMSGRTKRDQVFRIIGASSGSGHDVVQVQMSGVPTAFAAALVAIAGQNFTPGARWDRRLVPVARNVDLRIAMGGTLFGPTQDLLALWRLHRGSGAG